MMSKQKRCKACGRPLPESSRAALLARQGRTLRALADEAGLPASTLTRWRQGSRLHAASAAKLAPVLGLSVERLEAL
jgi:transcriptional regulator with XRE-family HTH domain